jgi:hypothetical protein
MHACMHADSVHASTRVTCSALLACDVTCSCSIIPQLAALSDERDAAASGGGMAEGEACRRMVTTTAGKKGKKGVVGTRKGKKARRKELMRPLNVLDDENDGDEYGGGSESTESSAGGSGERQREHPFVVTEPGEVARAKKNGLDYLFHLYEQCRVFLLQVQSIAKLGGHKSPTKVRARTL